MEWVGVKDSLPEPDVDVLMFFAKSGLMAVGSMVYPDDTEHWTCNTGGEWYTDSACCPDFWAPLPKPPKQSGA